MGRTLLSDVLLHLGKSGYANMRDRVFDLHGLPSPPLREKLRPDYRKIVRQVYRETFNAHSENTHRLELLQKCYLIKIESPFWVPVRNFPPHHLSQPRTANPNTATSTEQTSNPASSTAATSQLTKVSLPFVHRIFRRGVLYVFFEASTYQLSCAHCLHPSQHATSGTNIS